MAKNKETSQKYVYGVVRKSKHSSVDGEGLRGAAVDLVELDEIGALTSDVEESELEADRDDLMAHSRVLEKAQEGGTVLPMRFGIVMPDEDTVREELLSAHREELESQLAEFEDKSEINIKGIYEEDAILKEIVEANPRIQELQESIRGLEEDASYPQRAELGEIVAKSLEATRDEESQKFIERLGEFAEDVVVGEPSHERMAVNASFLVHEDKLDEFDKAIDELGEEQADRISFKYTGPLPPHSFVKLTVEEQAAEE